MKPALKRCAPKAIRSLCSHVAASLSVGVVDYRKTCVDEDGGDHHGSSSSIGSDYVPLLGGPKSLHMTETDGALDLGGSSGTIILAMNSDLLYDADDELTENQGLGDGFHGVGPVDELRDGRSDLNVDHDDDEELQLLYHADDLNLMRQADGCGDENDGNNEDLLGGPSEKLRSELGRLGSSLTNPPRLVRGPEERDGISVADDLPTSSSSSSSSLSLAEEISTAAAVTVAEDVEDNSADWLTQAVGRSRHLMLLHDMVCRTRHMPECGRPAAGTTATTTMMLERLECMSWELGVLSEEIQALVDAYEAPAAAGRETRV
ncbi:MAG: hypothetical protein Q9163_001000 [Psora crenata]